MSGSENDNENPEGGGENGTDGSSNGSDDTTEEGGGKPLDSTFTTNMWQNPSTMQFNPYFTKDYSEWAESYLLEEYARYLPVSDEFRSILIKEWSFGDQKMTVTMSEDYSWHGGSSVTAQDAVTDLWLRKGMNLPVGTYIDTIDTTGEYTFEIGLSTSVGKSVFLPLLFQLPLRGKHERFGEYAKQFREASSEDEQTAVQEKLIQTRMEEPFGDGPWQVSSIETTSLIYEPFDDHPNADVLNFPTVEMQWTESNQERYQMFKSDNLDGGGAFTPESVLESYPDHLEEIRVPVFNGSGIAFQHDHPDFGKRNVRQAIAYVIDRAEVGESIYAPVNTTVEDPNGIPPSLIDTWIPDVKDKLTPYKTNTEKAAALLEEAGYTKEGGNWVNENGEPIEGTIAAPAGWANQVQGWEHASSLLTQFGLNVDTRPVENTAFFSKTLPNGDYTMAQTFWGGGSPHPYFSFQIPFGPSSNTRQNSNIPLKTDVPMPIGDSDGSMQTIGFEQKLKTLVQAEREQAAEIAGELAWAFNQMMPILPVVEKKQQMFLTNDHWAYPDTDEPITTVAPLDGWLQRRGELTAKTE
jgi:peptide/nickel transport system substrate-binding protein